MVLLVCCVDCGDACGDDDCGDDCVDRVVVMITTVDVRFFLAIYTKTAFPSKSGEGWKFGCVCNTLFRETK